MAKISTYEEDSTPQLADKVMGTSIAGPPDNNTSNFTFQSILGLFLPEITLQKVVNAGNTIVMPTTVSKGIDITLANLETVGQNGISVTIPNQTGTPYPAYFSAPDAYVAKINGQSPGTLTGFTGGFVVDAHGLDNIAFYAELQSDSGESSGCVMKSVDSHVGDLFRGTKLIGATESTVFKVASNGDTTAKSLFLYDNQDQGVLMTLAASASSTGDLLRCFKDSVITTKVDTNGNITAPSLTTTGKVLIGTTEAGQPAFGITPQLVVTAPYTGGIGVGGVIDLRNLSPTIGANALLGRIQFTGKDDSSVGYTSSAIEGIASNTAGSGNPGGGVLIFKTAADSTGAILIEKMRITPNGIVQPGTDNAYSLGGSGIRWSSVWAVNGTIQTSDEREKKDIVDSDLGLDFVSKLRPVSFKWKVGKNEVTGELDGLDEEGNPKTKIVVTPIEGKRTHYGLIAQEVETLLDGKDFGGFIHDAETDIKGLRYDQFIPVLINAIKELKAEIEILKAK